MSLFPIFLKLEGRRCLVVGAGATAESKIKGLLFAAADVHVVAPRATPVIRGLARVNKVHWERRRFQPRDLVGVFLVVAATSSAKLHERIFQQARRRGVLCNAVDEPERCDFYYPAVVRRGRLQLAISTGGASPALAQRLRRSLEKQFTHEYGEWVEQLGKSRRELLAQPMHAGRRRRALHRLASGRAFSEFLEQQRIATSQRGRP